MKLLPILFAVAIPAGAATTYYVDAAAGSDSNPGTSTSLAWQSVYKVNSTALMPGDRVLFHRGQTWRDQLTISRSGVPGNPISYDAYGSGRKPTLAGSDVVTRWADIGGGAYAGSAPLQPYNVYADNGVALVPQGDANAVRGLAGSWARDAQGNLYVHLADSSNPSLHTIEIATRPFGIYSSASTYISVSNLEIRQTAQSGIYATSQNSSSVTENWTVSHCTIRNVREAGIYVLPSGQGGQPMLRGWVIQNNTIGTIDSSPTLNYDSAGLLIRGTTGAVIMGNAVATVNRFGIRVADYFGATPSAAPLVQANVLGMNEGNISIAYTSDAVVTNNYISNSKGYGIGIGGSSSTNATITDNVIVNLSISDDHLLYNGLDCNDGSTGGLFSYNTVVAVTNYSMTLEGDNNRPCSGWTVTNNIFDARANTPHPYANGITGSFYTVVPLSNIAFANNNYLPYPGSPNGIVRYLGTDYAFGNWAQITHEANVLSSDPQFLNPAGGDFTLRGNSPCKMSGGNSGCGRYTY